MASGHTAVQSCLSDCHQGGLLTVSLQFSTSDPCIPPHLKPSWPLTHATKDYRLQDSHSYVWELVLVLTGSICHREAARAISVPRQKDSCTLQIRFYVWVLMQGLTQGASLVSDYPSHSSPRLFAFMLILSYLV